MSSVDAAQFQWHPITEKPTCDCKVVLYIDRGEQTDAILAEFWHGFLCTRWCDMDRYDDDATVLAWSLRPDPICQKPETNTSSV